MTTATCNYEHFNHLMSNPDGKHGHNSAAYERSTRECKSV